MTGLAEMLKAARGDEPVDVLLTGGKILNVFTGEWLEHDLAIYQGAVVGHSAREAKETIQLNGALVIPGLIDAHIHIESTMLTPPELANVLAPRGVSTLVADPHEIANVHGLDGIRWIIDHSRNLPIEIFYWLPSCVPACPLDTSGAALEASDLAELATDPLVVGLGEMMNFPGAIAGFPDVLAKIKLAMDNGWVMDGHAPMAAGSDLDAYLVTGIDADHEVTTPEEAMEKLRRGMRLMIREGSAARNLADLLPVINENTWPRISFITDDRHPDHLLREGAVDGIVRKAMKLGLDPVTAIRLATITPAQRMGWKERGHLGIGAAANFSVLRDLESFDVQETWFLGNKVAENGATLSPVRSAIPTPPSINVANVTPETFLLPDGEGIARVIGIQKGQIVTDDVQIPLKIVDGNPVHLPDDVVRLAVLERHTGSGRVGSGFVKGLGLKRGAYASSVAHDSHNLVVAGCDPDSMNTAIKTIISSDGGLALADGDHLLAHLPLPIAGLMSLNSGVEVARNLEQFSVAAGEIGLTDEMLMVLSFLALPVIPALKITDRGLVDVTQFKHVPLWIN